MSGVEIWPAAIGLLGLGDALVAVVRGRTFFIRSRDPDAAIYRESQPGFFWSLVAAECAIGVVLVVIAIVG
ncbi:MAG: hypothetical protein J7494_04860 [Sphingobium sp.]|nr:hypothetical protein [Sphingobium sp.]